METQDNLFRKREDIFISSLIDPYNPQNAFKRSYDILRPFDEYTEEDEYNYLEIEEYIEPYSNYYNNDTAILFSNIQDPQNNSIYNGLTFRGEIGEVNLENSAFINCWFDRANLSGSNFNNTIFMTEYIHDEVEKYGANKGIRNINEDKITRIREVNFVDVQMMNSQLYDVNIFRCNLTNINLTSSNLKNAKLINCNLTNANLTNVNLTGANLRNTNLTGANLTGANLTGAILSNTIFIGANLTNTNITDAVDITDETFNGANTDNIINNIEKLSKKASRLVTEEQQQVLNDLQLSGGKKSKKTKKNKKTKKTKKCKTKNLKKTKKNKKTKK
jgi:uncharacterized protein YjbI with pentapeptide repeats